MFKEYQMLTTQVWKNGVCVYNDTPSRFTEWWNREEFTKICKGSRDTNGITSKFLVTKSSDEIGNVVTVISRKDFPFTNAFSEATRVLEKLSLRAKVENTKNLVRMGIVESTKLGEDFKAVEEKTESIYSTSEKFKQKSRRTNACCFWRNW